MLDANNNGRISADEISLDKIPIELLQVFKPLLLEMENFAEELDRDEFIESSLALLEVLDLRARNAVLYFGKKIPRSASIFDAELKFHPQIT